MPEAQRLITNNPHLAPLEKSCADAPPHKHEVISGGPAVRHTARYADFFAATYAACLRLSWRNGFQPGKVAYKEEALEAFASLLHVPEKDEASNAVHVRAGSASSSGPPEPGARSAEVPAAAAAVVPAAAPAAVAGAAAPAAADPPKDDFWEETTNTWIRNHVVPRTRLFVPESLDGAPTPAGHPSVEFLQDVRYTLYAWHGAKYDKKSSKVITLKDLHSEAGTRALKHQWTGKIIFLKKGSPASYPVEGDKPLSTLSYARP